MNHPSFDDLLTIRTGTLEMTMGREPTYLSNINTAEQWQQKAEALRELFRLMLAEPPQGYHCEPAPTIIDEKEHDDYLHRTIQFNVAPEERICGHLLIPRHAPKPCPAVITLHPTTTLGMEQTIGNDPTPQGQDRAYGLHLANRGLVTLSYDLLSTGRRCYPGHEPFDTAPFYQQCPDWSVRGKDIWDVSRAVDLLETVPEVDPQRIGCLGHSQGGGITIDAMVLEPRIKAGVSNCGDWPMRLSKNPFNICRDHWWVGMPRLRSFAFCGKTYPIDLHEKLALIAPRAIMNISALNDYQYDRTDANLLEPAFANLQKNVKKTFNLLEHADNFQMCLHWDGHSFLPSVREIAYDFIQLGLC